MLAVDSTARSGPLAGAGAAELRRRMELVGDAEHELRGPVTVLALLSARMLREASCRAYGEALDAQLARMRIALEDLTAARQGRVASGRPAMRELRRLVERTLAGWGGGELDWRADGARVVADPGHLAQALGNLVANANEHGDGDVAVTGRAVDGAVRVEVRNRPAARRLAGPDDRVQAGRARGRGLRIASRATAAAGGRLELSEHGGEVVAALELPLAAGNGRPSHAGRAPRDEQANAGQADAGPADPGERSGPPSLPDAA